MICPHRGAGGYGGEDVVPHEDPVFTRGLEKRGSGGAMFPHLSHWHPPVRRMSRETKAPGSPTPPEAHILVESRLLAGEWGKSPPVSPLSRGCDEKGTFFGVDRLTLARLERGLYALSASAVNRHVDLEIGWASEWIRHSAAKAGLELPSPRLPYSTAAGDPCLTSLRRSCSTSTPGRVGVGVTPTPPKGPSRAGQPLRVP